MCVPCVCAMHILSRFEPRRQTLGIMKHSLTERWGSWVELCAASGPAGNMVTYKFLESVIWPELQKDGYTLPSRRGLHDACIAGLGELPVSTTGTRGHAQVRMCSFAHVLHLVWGPVLAHLASDSLPNPIANRSAIVAEMAGVVLSASETLDMDMFVMFIRDTLFRLLQVHVPTRLIWQVVSPVVPFQAEPTRATAMHILRSSLCSQLVGSTMAAQANRLILAEIADVPVQPLADAAINSQVRQELIDALEQHHCGPELSEAPGGSPAKKFKRTQAAQEEMLIDKTKQVLYVLQNRIANSRVNATIVGAINLVQNLSAMPSGTADASHIEDALVNRVRLAQHMQILDGAVDRCTSDKLLRLREEGRFAGIAFVTDESPPKQPRFRGLRFQITVFYWGAYKDLQEWNTRVGPPIVKSTCLADVMHCPGKKGVDVSRIIEKQLARIGLNGFDVAGGVGDGGGENEGHQGVHAYFENLNPGYVRHRCVPHISWRTCDVAIRVSGLEYKALAAYFVEGITWSRLRELATRAAADAGLGLFRDGSQQCKDVFARSPSAIVDNRPETDLEFLKFLAGKEHIFHKLATEDLKQRSLSAETKNAILSLGDILARIRRRILQEILERCLLLYYWIGKHPSVARESSWDVLMQKAVSSILSVEITPQVLERFLLKDEDLQALSTRPRTWIELAVLQVVGEEAEVAARLPEALDFHRSVTDQAAAHLNLLADNTFRTPWMAAKLLSEDPALARDSARSLVKHLATARPSNRTAFEQHLFDSEELWKNLDDFARADPPVLLWHCDGKYEVLFKFLAPRFLLAPDHVLDAERVHARWQWSCSQKRSLKLQSLNASLRLTHHLERNQAMPEYEDLVPNMQAELREHRLALEALEDAGDVALGWR